MDLGQRTEARGLDSKETIQGTKGLDEVEQGLCDYRLRPGVVE